RRLRHGPLFHRPGGREPTHLVLLHERRRRRDGGAQRRLEVRARRTEGAAAPRLDGAVRQAPAAADVQPAPGPVRARAGELEHLLRLGRLPRLHAVRDAGAGGRADRRLQEVPAAPETGLVQPGRGHAATRSAPLASWRPVSRSGYGHSTNDTPTRRRSTTSRGTGAAGPIPGGAGRSITSTGPRSPTASVCRS